MASFFHWIDSLNLVSLCKHTISYKTHTTWPESITAHLVVLQESSWKYTVLISQKKYPGCPGHGSLWFSHFHSSLCLRQARGQLCSGMEQPVPRVSERFGEPWTRTNTRTETLTNTHKQTSKHKAVRGHPGDSRASARTGTAQGAALPLTPASEQVRLFCVCNRNKRYLSFLAPSSNLNRCLSLNAVYLTSILPTNSLYIHTYIYMHVYTVLSLNTGVLLIFFLMFPQL